MKWKKFFKYFLSIWLIVTLLLIVFANYGLSGMYGGHTKKADQGQFNLEATPVAIHNVNILAPDGKSFIPDQTVVLADGVIVSCDSTPILSEEIQVINGSGKYLIPGLIDAHVHLFKSPNDLLLYVANGVTQIRELIGSEELLGWREEIKQGRIGPEIYVSSPRLGSFGLVEGWFMSWAQGYDNIRNAEEAKEAVESYYKKGYNGIKIYSQLNKESYKAISQAAKTIGMPIMGHIPESVGLKDIYQSGQSGIAHFEEIMNALNREFGYYTRENSEEFLNFINERSKEVANNLIKHNIVVSSTLWGADNFLKQKFSPSMLLKEVELKYVNPGISEWSEFAPGGPGWLPQVNMYRLPENMTPEDSARHKWFWSVYSEAERLVAKNLIKYKVKIMTGTDANIPMKVPGFALHNEFHSLITAGMSPSQILQSATSIPAEWMKSNTGKIAPGRKANLVLLNKNPLHDIRNTQTIQTVFLNGRVFDRAVLDQMLNAVEEANNASRSEDISQYLITK